MDDQGHSKQSRYNTNVILVWSVIAFIAGIWAYGIYEVIRWILKLLLHGEI